MNRPNDEIEHVQLAIYLDKDTYGHFLNNNYSRIDTIAVHTAIMHGVVIPKNTGHLKIDDVEEKK